MKFLPVVLFMLMLVARLRSDASGDIPPEFFRALRTVETGNRSGYIVGDRGRALGPYQITWAYWFDSGVPGQYSQVSEVNYAQAVITAYMNRYARSAIQSRDWVRLARIHNGGPRGDRRRATEAYARRFEAEMNGQP